MSHLPAILRMTFRACCVVMITILMPVTGGAAHRISPRLNAMLAAAGPGEQVPAWVYFTDKGRYEPLRIAVPRELVSERSLRRRMKVRPLSALVDYADLPVDPSYVAQVASRAGRIRQQSKWLNGVSVEATADQIRELASLPAVASIDVLARFRRAPEPQPELPSASGTTAPVQPEGISSFDYGPSFGQLNQIAVPPVHDLGNQGQGVVIGVFDNGFRLLTHEAFDTLRPRILATYDFVDHKVSVVPDNPDPGFGSHGVNTLSTIGGFRAGQLIGPAFAATYVLGRTENDSSETPVEEDNWIAAIEWADSLGVDVTSTSLSYLTYDPPFTSWTWEDMDGNTTAITRVADMAAGRGIVVVNSASNSGNNPSHNTLGAPADGDSVFTIGAVTSSGARSSFSSVGPTTSVPPRIKPDVMAQGTSVRVASATNPAGYGYSSGTSFSCPLAAGVVALMIHARPSDSPVEIMDALRSTASRATAPDNLYGWGIINALAALMPSAATPVLPPDGAQNQPLTIEFLWKKSRWATAYHLQVAEDTGFTILLLNDSTLTDTARVVTGLDAGRTYRWRVRAKNSYGAGAFPPSRSFATALLPPAPPVPASPPDGATGIQGTVVLSWNPSEGSLTYRLQVATDSLFGAIILDDSSLTVTTTSVTGLVPALEHYWRVRGANTSGPGQYSPPWRFSTEGSVVRSYPAAQGWNLLSLPLLVSDPTASAVFPGAGSQAFTFDPVQGYVARESLAIGQGYWLRFDTSDTAIISGIVFWDDTVAVSPGWNLVGGPSSPVDVSAVTTLPAGIRDSGFYEYGVGYALAPVLQPARGYWVKIRQAGVLLLRSIP